MTHTSYPESSENSYEASEFYASYTNQNIYSQMFQVYQPQAIDSVQRVVGSLALMQYCNEVDRFGFSSLLNYILNNTYNPKRAFSSWVHGWKWFDIKSPAQLGFNQLSNKGTFSKYKHAVVLNQHQKDLLESFGCKRVWIGSIPAAYLSRHKLPISTHRHFLPKDTSRDTIIILPKSQSSAPHRSSFSQLVDYVNDSNELRHRSILCIYAQDIMRKSVQDIISSQSIPFVIGAHPLDAYSLVRTFSLFSSFDNYITNTLGTHIPYLASMGKTIKFADQVYDERTPDDLKCLLEGRLKPETELFEYHCYVHSKHYFNNNLKFLVDPDFWVFKSKQWGSREMGTNNLIKGASLNHILGWSTPSRMKQLALASINRLERTFY